MHPKSIGREKSAHIFSSLTVERWKVPFWLVLWEGGFFYNEDEEMSEGGGAKCS